MPSHKPVGKILQRHEYEAPDSHLAAWHVLAELEVEADCDYVDFTGLDGDTDKAYIIFCLLDNASGISSEYYIFVNQDYTHSNYYRQWLYASGAAIGASRINNPNFAFAETPGCCLARLEITRDPDYYFRAQSHIVYNIPTSLTISLYAVMKTAMISNITSLRIAAEHANGIGIGSRFTLCRPRS